MGSENRCLDHLEFTGSICPDCGLEVDRHGNTENQFEYCSFPNCGCDGARLCMAGEASPQALLQNVEGMWRGKTKNRTEALSAIGWTFVQVSPESWEWIKFDSNGIPLAKEGSDVWKEDLRRLRENP